MFFNYDSLHGIIIGTFVLLYLHKIIDLFTHYEPLKIEFGDLRHMIAYNSNIIIYKVLYSYVYSFREYFNYLEELNFIQIFEIFSNTTTC